MLVELWPIDRPKDYPHEPAYVEPTRGGESRCLDPRVQLAAAGRVVDANGVIVIGHLRRAAGKPSSG